MLWNVVALYLGLIVVWGAEFIHEAAHWIFTVPFGGSLENGHILPNPGWANVMPAPNPWGTITFYAGGLSASFFLLAFLCLMVWRFRQTGSRFWWWLGLSLAFGVSAELVAGLFEGAFPSLYTPTLFLPIAILIGLAGCLVYWRVIPPGGSNTTTEYRR